MRSPAMKAEHDLYIKALRRYKKAKGLCGWQGCKNKTTKRPFGTAYVYCDEHRKYCKETRIVKVMADRKKNSTGLPGRKTQT